MKKYELLLILPGTLDEKEAEKRSGEIVEMVKEYGTEAVLSTLGKNRLAYPVRQIRYGYFYTIVFSAEAQKLKDLEKKLSLTRDLLRAIITRFNIDLNAHQRTAYAGDTLGKVSELLDQTTPEDQHMVAESPVKETKKTDKADKVDMDEVKKKLDKILEESDIIPGV
jgi:small subunit ribosomal protein S6